MTGPKRAFNRGRCRDGSTAQARDLAGRRTCLDSSHTRSVTAEHAAEPAADVRAPAGQRSIAPATCARPPALELTIGTAMMAMPMPMGAMSGAAPMQPTIVIVAAPAPAPTDTHGSPSQHREISSSPLAHHESPHASDHSSPDASPPESHSHEHLTEAIEDVLETVLSRHESHGEGDQEHRNNDKSHLKSGLAIAAGSAILKRTLERSTKVRKPVSEHCELTERRSTIVAKTRPVRSRERYAAIEWSFCHVHSRERALQRRFKLWRCATSMHSKRENRPVRHSDRSSEPPGSVHALGAPTSELAAARSRRCNRLRAAARC